MPRADLDFPDGWTFQVELMATDRVRIFRLWRHGFESYTELDKTFDDYEDANKAAWEWVVGEGQHAKDDNGDEWPEWWSDFCFEYELKFGKQPTLWQTAPETEGDHGS